MSRFTFTLKRLLMLLLLLAVSACSGATSTEGEPVASGPEDTATSTTAPATAVVTTPTAPIITAAPSATATANFSCDLVSEIPAAECQALVILFEATGGPTWQDNSGWLTTTTPCSWTGVTCVDNHVDGLALASNNLQGELPATLADLTHLRVLDLHHNAITGSIPFDLGELPTLTELDLSFNQLTGTVPSALYQVAHHRLWGNQLEGTIFPGENGQQIVNYLGAVFTFDHMIADSVWLELVPAQPAEPGPGMVWAPSQHIVFTLANAAGAQNHAPLGQYLPAEAQIHVYPITGLNAEVQPVVDGLRQLLAEPPDAAALEAISLGQDSFLPGLTLLPPSNARQPFRAQVEYLTFVGGRGVRYLTQLSQGPVPVSNQELFYTFQGLTDDGALYVAAYFPVTLPALPDSPEMSDEALTALVEDWLGYLTQTTQLLNESAAASFTPDLIALDTLINSLSVSGTLDLPVIESISPGNEEIVNSQPVLQWQSFPGAVNYHVIVLNDGAYPPQVVFDQFVTETMFTVDPPLLPGHYSWTVWAQDEQGTVIAGLTGTFSVNED
ncbi:MAG: leucine-rich repeat domain-containing protein [Chloroflexi bacterium]|nr:leucine-rich repeat domain-containing protein [Chloroflexota bacterium]